MRFTDLFLIIPPLIFFALLGPQVRRLGMARARALPRRAVVDVDRAASSAACSCPCARRSTSKRRAPSARATSGSSSSTCSRTRSGPIIVNATITVAVAILVETSLSFLGLGVQAPDTSLGKLISDNQQSATTRPWLFYFPGFYIILIALTVNFLGDGLRDAFDPTQRRVQGLMADILLEVADLSVDFPSDDGVVHAVRGVTYGLSSGEVLAIVGESGSGKSVSCLAIMGLLPKSARIQGSATYRGTELLGMKPKELNRIRGNRIAMIFQDPMTSLNPVYSVGWQLAEAVRAHHKDVSKSDAWTRAVDLLELVDIPNPQSGRRTTRTSSPAACASGR